MGGFAMGTSKSTEAVQPKQNHRVTMIRNDLRNRFLVTI